MECFLDLKHENFINEMDEALILLAQEEEAEAQNTVKFPNH